MVDLIDSKAEELEQKQQENISYFDQQTHQSSNIKMSECDLRSNSFVKNLEVVFAF